MQMTLPSNKISQIIRSSVQKQASVFAKLLNVRLLASTCLFASLGLAMSGCTLLPGMSARYFKSPIVEESPEEPASTSYTLIKITPKLAKDMNAERLAAEKRSLGAGTFGNADDAVMPYTLGPQDTLRIFVWGNPDLTPVTTTVAQGGASSMPAGRTINDKGELYFPFVGSIQAAGLTVPQFREELSKKLSKYIKDPQVEVDVAAFRSKKVFLAGEVRQPGIVPITDQPLRITDAIGLAGGLTPEADLYNAVLTRNKVTVTINLDRIYYGGETSANILLHAGDVLGIPDRQVRKIFILGEVGNAAGINQSRSYVMRRGRMSLTEAISDAGGLNPFSAAPGKVYVMRADQNGEPLIYQLNASDAASLILAEQFTMRPRDVVFVSPTDITELGRFVAQFFPLTSGVQAVANTPF